MDFQLKSSAFQPGEPIPQEYTADGLNNSPPLEWSDPPDATKSFALVCEDPDAQKGTFPHWVVFNIPPQSHELGAGFPRERERDNGTTQGTNGAGEIGYMGPAPPRGEPHHYVFKLYALDTRLGLKPGTTVEDLRSAIGGHVLAESELIGTYRR